MGMWEKLTSNCFNQIRPESPVIPPSIALDVSKNRNVVWYDPLRQLRGEFD